MHSIRPKRLHQSHFLIDRNILPITCVDDDVINRSHASITTSFPSYRFVYFLDSVMSPPPPPPHSALSVVAFPKNSSAKVGDRVIFECLFVGADVVVRWNRVNGSGTLSSSILCKQILSLLELPKSDERIARIGSNLVIRTVQANDEGTYSCRGSHKSSTTDVVLYAQLTILSNNSNSSKSYISEFVCRTADSIFCNRICLSIKTAGNVDSISLSRHCCTEADIRMVSKWTRTESCRSNKGTGLGVDRLC